MKTFNKVLFVLAILIANSISASAIEFTVDGVRYSVNNDNTTVTVAGYSSDSEPTGDLTIPESVTYGGISYPVTSIGDGAFNNCIGLTSVTIPNSVTSIGYMAFYWCSGLTSVTIPNSVTSIDDMAFGSCSGLTSVTIPNSVTEIGRGAFSDTAWYNNQPDGLVYAGLVAYKYKGMMPSGTSIVLKEGTKGIADNAFFDCLGLTSVTIPNSVISIGDGAFGECSGLTSVTIPNSVTSIGVEAFYDCTGLTSVTIGNSVTSIGDWAFTGCSGLTSVTIPNSVTSIGDNAFGACNGLTSVTIPNSVTSIGSMAFWGCSGLTSVTIPNSVTSIGESAFGGCSGLTSLTIPNSVTSIGERAFDCCSGLTRIDAYPDPEKVSTGVNVFYYVPKDGTLHVLPQYLSAYQTASPWKDFTNIKGDLTDISGIEEVSVDELDHTLPMNVYNINGVKMDDRLEDLPAGIYIVRQGSKSAKVVK